MGAPGAGKSELAKRMARSLNRDRSEFRWRVVDEYVQFLVEKTGRSYGEAADIPHNAQIMAERWTREATAIHQGYSTITCGTIYETIVYNALTRLYPPEEETLRFSFYTEARIGMEFFSLMERMTFNYDALFFLPLNIDDGEHSWPAVVNAKIPEVLEITGRYAVPLSGELRPDLKHALEIVRYQRDLLTSVEAEAPSDQ